MDYNILVLIVIAIFGTVAVAAFAKKFRHAFLVPEGYAGLLYHKGKFVEVLHAGRHIRWGRHFTLDTQDLRKAAMLVAGLAAPFFTVDQYAKRLQSSLQRSLGRRVELQDVHFSLFKGPGFTVGHVTIYVGNNQVITAPQPGEVIKLASVDMMPPYGYGRP